MNFTPEVIMHIRKIATKAMPRLWYINPFSKQVTNAKYIDTAVNTHEAALTVIEQQRAEIERLRKAGKAAFILIREQLDIMDDEDAEEVMNDLHTAIEGGEE